MNDPKSAELSAAVERLRRHENVNYKKSPYFFPDTHYFPGLVDNKKRMADVELVARAYLATVAADDGGSVEQQARVYRQKIHDALGAEREEGGSYTESHLQAIAELWSAVAQAVVRLDEMRHQMADRQEFDSCLAVRGLADRLRPLAKKANRVNIALQPSEQETQS